ncbi:MAG: AAA family ATPase [Vicinamibacterales bacterium]
MIVAFLGTKGGTGTTTMAVNVAAELHRVTGRPTVLVDLKPAPGDVALFLGLRPRHTLTQALDRLAWEDEAALSELASVHACGLDVLPAGDEWGRPGARDADNVELVLDALGRRYAFVVLDAGNALTPSATAGLAAADRVVLVANPDVPCLRNLPRLIDAIRLEGVPADRLRLLLNRASDDVAVSLAQMATVVGVPVDWSVPSDYRTVSAAVTSGVPIRAIRATSPLPAHLSAVSRALADEAGGLSTSTATVAPSDDSGASQ